MEKIETAIICYKSYMGEGGYYILYWTAMLLLVMLAWKKADLLSKKIVTYTIIISIIYWCPVSAGFLLKYLTGGNVYCRMFWMFPVSVVIAYVAVYLIKNANDKRKRIGTLIVVTTIIALSGKYMFSDENYSEATNMSKLPEVVLQVCDTIEVDAELNQVDSMKAIVEDDLVCYIRQYDGNIRMNYGRSGLQWDNAYTSVLNAESFDGYTLISLATSSQSNYLVLRKDKDLSTFVEENVCRIVGSYGDYVIYYVNCTSAV